MNRTVCFIGLVLLGYGSIYAQEKYEREYRISTNEVPPIALKFVMDVGFSKTIKWYREQGLETTTIEAKTRHKGSIYSLEFTKEGVLEDIEYIVKWKDMPSEARSRIKVFLEMEHDKTKLQKIQQQYTGDAIELKELMMGAKPPSVATIRYEIVVKAKTKGIYETIEYLFSDEGIMERKSIIVEKNTDNLEF